MAQLTLAGEEANTRVESEYKIFSKEEIIEDAFVYFRKAGFPYPKLEVHEIKQIINQLADMTNENLMYTSVGARVGDVYNGHRFAVEVEGMRTTIDSFHDDKVLHKSLKIKIESDGKLDTRYFSKMSLANGTQGAANFKPGYALLMYRKYAKQGDVVLDTSTGFGGRLIGYIASGIHGKYIGIDPNTLTYQGNLKMARDLGYEKEVELINLPVEDVPYEYAEKCDFAFTSPPYFRKEHYSTEPTQSWVRYKTGDAWKAGFLLKMLQFQYHALKPGARSVINISPVKIKDVIYPLTEWTIECAEKVGFKHIDNEKYPLPPKYGAFVEDKPLFEPAPVFRKI